MSKNYKETQENGTELLPMNKPMNKPKLTDAEKFEHFKFSLDLIINSIITTKFESLAINEARMIDISDITGLKKHSIMVTSKVGFIFDQCIALKNQKDIDLETVTNFAKNFAKQIEILKDEDKPSSLRNPAVNTLLMHFEPHSLTLTALCGDVFYNKITTTEKSKPAPEPKRNTTSEKKEEDKAITTGQEKNVSSFYKVSSKNEQKPEDKVQVFYILASRKKMYQEDLNASLTDFIRRYNHYKTPFLYGDKDIHKIHNSYDDALKCFSNGNKDWTSKHYQIIAVKCPIGTQPEFRYRFICEENLMTPPERKIIDKIIKLFDNLKPSMPTLKLPEQIQDIKSQADQVKRGELSYDDFCKKSIKLLEDRITTQPSVINRDPIQSLYRQILGVLTTKEAPRTVATLGPIHHGP